MDRMRVVLCVSIVAGLLAAIPSEGRAQQPADGTIPPGDNEIYVIVKAELYEVDGALYRKLVKAKRLSRADLEKLEEQILDAPKENTLEAPAMFAQLDKQKLLLAGKEIHVGSGQEGVLLAKRKAVHCLPRPERLQQGLPLPQKFEEGITLSAEVTISADRRYVRARFTEVSLELEGSEKVKVILDQQGNEAVGEIAFIKEGKLSQTRDIPDGWSLLLPLEYRPAASRDSDRWLVARVRPLIYIEEEELIRRGKGGK